MAEYFIIAVLVVFTSAITTTVTIYFTKSLVIKDLSDVLLKLDRAAVLSSETVGQLAIQNQAAVSTAQMQDFAIQRATDMVEKVLASNARMEAEAKSVAADLAASHRRADATNTSLSPGHAADAFSKSS